jgi:hypothetical protein
MKKIITSDISTGIGMPIKSGTLDHLQSAYKEALDFVTRNLIGNYDANKVYIISGCVLYLDGAVTKVTEGAMFYGGEIYLVDNSSIGIAPFNYPICNISTTFFSGTNADPVNFTDGIDRNVHEIKKITLANGTSGSGLIDFVDCTRLDWQTKYDAGVVSVTTGTATITSCRLRYKKQGDSVIINYKVNLDVISYDSSILELAILLPILADIQNTGFNMYNSGTFINTTNTRYGSFCEVRYINAFIDPQLIVNVNNSELGNCVIAGQIIYPTKA